MAVLSESIERSGRSRALKHLAKAVGWSGYRRQLAARFASWTRDERPIEGPIPADSEVASEEWSLFRSYRETLGDLRAEDPEGWAVWASRTLAKHPPPPLRKPGHVFVFDPLSPTRAGWRLLDHFQKWAKSMTVTLPFDPDPALAELYCATDAARRRFLDEGFVEDAESSDGLPLRPAGLLAIERELFRSDSHERPRLRIDRDKGLEILGGPSGEGLSLLVAREVRRQLERGLSPEEILILVPRLDEEADRIRETLLAWNLPVDRGRGRRLSTIAAISALRLAMTLPVEGWEVKTLVRLLRNGQVRWSHLDRVSKFGRFEAASAMQATRVFRNRATLRESLERDRGDAARERTANVALRALEQLGEVIDSSVGSGPWEVQVGRSRSLAEELGLEPAELEPLWDALDDQGWVFEGLGAAVAEESWTWAQFVGQVDSTIAEIAKPAPPPEPGTVRIEAVDQAEGARATVVILANLAERTFPTPDAIHADSPVSDPVEPAGRPNLAYSREMLRFARVAGSAGERLVLAYPTTDISGEALLPAGFLDDLMRRFDGPTDRACVERHARFDPVLLNHRDLAKSGADARVLAVALAALENDVEALRSLSARPEHSGALLGTADAFRVAHLRRLVPTFGPYDGRLQDPNAIDKIRGEFGPDHAFSASQLESFALCPFQFYQRYVLGLKAVDERQELDEDYAGRGSDVHRVLEQIHLHAEAEGTTELIDRLKVLIETEMRVELEQYEAREASVPEVLKELGTRRTNKALGRYIWQFRSYFEKAEPSPHKFEVEFGQEDHEESPDSLPPLTIGDGPDAVKLQGKIDRVDLVRDEDKDEVRFRVIDYKTGSNAPGKDVLSGLASQLPLYALAVERLLFPDGPYEFLDAGYWSLPKDGFKGVKIKEWEAYRDQLMAFVLDIVSQLRNGTFPIESQKKDCRKFCDYHSACRVGEVRMVGKSWVDRPRLGGGS
jgi:RecB family exonuclease